MKLRYTVYFILLLLLFSRGASAQTGSKPLRIVDTLTIAERSGRDPVLLRSELDSLINEHSIVPVQQKQEPVIQVKNNHSGIIIALIAVAGLLGFILYLLFRQQQKINGLVAAMREPQQASAHPAAGREKKGRTTVQSLENKINDLHAELGKLSKENEGMQRVIKEYNGIQHEYDSLKHGIHKVYKVKNYPGYDRQKGETSVMQAVLETENAVAAYAYEKFLKPILTITDANKNSPARLNKEDQERILDLLVSLSFLYIEYLYLRVNDLSVGGKMVERIQGLSKGNGIDPSLLKKMNTEFGSRALVMKMALNKTGVNGLSYPVFDETDLNN